MVKSIAPKVSIPKAPSVPGLKAPATPKPKAVKLATPKNSANLGMKNYLANSKSNLF